MPLTTPVPSVVVAAGAGVFLSDDLRDRVASLATAQNVTPDAMLNALVEREELCRQLSPSQVSVTAVPEQQIAGIVSRHFAALSGRSEMDAWHRVQAALVRELTESDLLSFHAGNIAESRRLNWRKQQGTWGSRAELDEAARSYTQRLAEGITENGIFIGGNEQNVYRLHSYAEKHYAWAMR